jgi:hypothetical protein
LATIQLHNPQAPLPQAIEVTSELASLRESRLGVLANTKQNAEVLLNQIADDLAARYGVMKVLTGTRPATERCNPAQIEEFAASCEWVITGSAD